MDTYNILAILNVLLSSGLVVGVVRIAYHMGHFKGDVCARLDAIERWQRAHAGGGERGE